jgi:transposase-like protein
VDKRGQSVDFYLSRKPGVNAAKIFPRKAIKHRRVPTNLTLDAYAASHRAAADLEQSRELPQRVKVRSSKYLNNLVEQDHRSAKQRLGLMLGLKSFRNAAVVIGGIEVAAQIQKDQFPNGKAGWANSPSAGGLARRPGCVAGLLLIELRRPTELRLIPDLHQNHSKPGASSRRANES